MTACYSRQLSVILKRLQQILRLTGACAWDFDTFKGPLRPSPANLRTLDSPQTLHFSICLLIIKLLYWFNGIVLYINNPIILEHPIHQNNTEAKQECIRMNTNTPAAHDMPCFSPFVGWEKHLIALIDSYSHHKLKKQCHHWYVKHGLSHDYRHALRSCWAW